MRQLLGLVLVIAILLPQADGGLALYGVCQAGCAGIVVACYAAAGYTFGTVTAGVGTPLAIQGCNSAFGFCSAKCAAVTLVLPTP